MASITVTIPDAKFAKFKKAFIKMNPIPEDPDTQEPLFAENEWIKEWIKRVLFKRYKQGREALARETAVIDNDVLD